MKFTIFYHKEVTKDFLKLSGSAREIIQNAITSRLAFEPEKYGKLLHADLKGYFKMRVSKYRIVYQVQKERVEIYIIAIGKRRNEEVYHTAKKRRKE